MKNLMLFLFSISIISSCSPDSDLLFQIVSENNKGEGTSEDETTEEEEEEENEINEEEISYEGKLEVNTTPCDFNLDILSSGDTLLIGCQLDLNGETINIPSNVTLTYDGGEIINGTLDFANGGKIDGNLLNQFIEVKGDITLISDVFQFHPERWDIVQGQTTSNRAQENNTNLENLFFYTKEFGATTFVIDEFDAYFEISKVTSTTTNQNFYPSQEAINIPSNYTLQMTENTHLRVQPNARKNYCLIGIRNVANVKVIGGNLHGDRKEHDDFSQEGPHAFGMLLIIHGANNVDIDGVRMVDATGDGLDINSIGFTFQPDYIPANNIRVVNCIFDSNRRNNISITDGFDMIIENNQLLNAGIDIPGSEGMAPGYGLDIEAYRSKNSETGEYIYYEKAYDIIIRNNIERGSKYGAFIVAIGDDVLIEGNETENVIGIGAASGVKIIRNQITANNSDTTGAGITTGHPNSLTTYNNEISNNIISGYNIGIAAYQRDTKIFGNHIINFGVGIQPKDVKNMDIYENTFNSDKPSSIAIFGNLTSMENVNIFNNNIEKIGREAIKMVAVNENNENNKVVIRDNNFDASITISRSKGIEYINNNSKRGVIIVNSKNIEIRDNTIETSKEHGITISSGCSNMNIINNVINITEGNFDCINRKNDNGITISVTNNSCLN